MPREREHLRSRSQSRRLPRQQAQDSDWSGSSAVNQVVVTAAGRALNNGIWIATVSAVTLESIDIPTD